MVLGKMNPQPTFVFVSVTGPQNRCSARLVFVNILSIAEVGLPFPWINKTSYITVKFAGLLFPARSLRGLIRALLQMHLAVAFARSPPPSAFGSTGSQPSPFSVRSYPPQRSQRSSQALWLSLSLPLSLLVGSLTSSLWCLGECQAGRPWSDLVGGWWG